MPDNNLLLTVTAAPALHSERTVEKDCWRMLLAMAPAAVAAVVTWGSSAVGVMALAMLAGIATEAGCQRLRKQHIMVRDFTAATSCLMLAFLMPATAPWWLVVLGAVLAIALGKMAFGGTGANPLNATVVGWAMLAVSWPTLMAPNAMLLDTTLVDPLIRLKCFGASSLGDIGLWQLFTGRQIAGLGTGHGLLLLLGGLYIIYRGVIRWEIPVGFFAGVLIAALPPWLLDAGANASPVFHLLTGSTILCGFFIAPEWASSPSRRLAMLLYGIFGGTMVIVIRKYGIYPDGAPFAVLLANLLAPLLDCINPKPFGWKGEGK